VHLVKAVLRANKHLILQNKVIFSEILVCKNTCKSPLVQMDWLLNRTKLYTSTIFTGFLAHMTYGEYLFSGSTFPMLAVVVHSYTVMLLRLYELIIVFLKSENRGTMVMLSNVSHKSSAILDLNHKVEQKNKSKIHP
jgi:hypothetical protein